MSESLPPRGRGGPWVLDFQNCKMLPREVWTEVYVETRGWCGVMERSGVLRLGVRAGRGARVRLEDSVASAWWVLESSLASWR